MEFGPAPPDEKFCFSHFVCLNPCLNDRNSNFMTKIKDIISTDPPAPISSPFNFNMSNNAAEHNANILKDHDYDMTKVILAYKNSHIDYLSEFQSPSILEPLLNRSPFWEEVKKSLSMGS